MSRSFTRAFVQGVTAAAVAAIAGAVYILARRALIDLPTVLIAGVTFTVLTRTKKVPEPLLIMAAGVIGMLLPVAMTFRSYLRAVRPQTRSMLPRIWFTAFASLLFGQTNEAQTLPAPGAQGELLHIVHAARLDRAPKLDGTLDDPLWQQATPISNFLQREPYKGQPPEVRVPYTKHSVYFGIACHNSNPTWIRRHRTAS